MTDQALLYAKGSKYESGCLSSFYIASNIEQAGAKGGSFQQKLWHNKLSMKLECSHSVISP